jgi:hypothetical protein
MSSDDHDDAIREGEPPIFPRARRGSQEEASSIRCWTVCLIGLLSATAVLFAIVTPMSFTTAKAGFVLALIVAFSAAALLMKSDRCQGWTGILAVVLLIAASFLPIYVQHVGPPDIPRSHRHTLWWSDHIH